jgi:Domain of unknown function (DUF5063)
VEDRDVEHFLHAAREFCSTAESVSPATIVKELRASLTRAYLAALELSDRDPPTLEVLEAPPQPGISPITEPLRAAFGDGDVFTVVFDATEPTDDDPYESSLAQEVGEIYEDLKEAIALLETHGPTPDCVWDVKWAFENHWGLHAVHVLPALHQLARYR